MASRIISSPDGVIVIKGTGKCNIPLHLHCSLPLFYHFISTWSNPRELGILDEVSNEPKKPGNILFVAIEDSVQNHLRHLSTKLKTHDNIHFIDAFSDPVGWDDDESTSNKNTKKCTHVNDLQSFYNTMKGVYEGLPTTGEKSYLVFDSISPLILRHGIQIFQFLRRLSSPSEKFYFGSVLCLVHADVHSDSIIQQLDYISTTTITVSPPPPTTYNYTMAISLLHKRKAGKIAQVEEYVQLDKNGNASFFSPAKLKHHHDNQPNKAADPTADLTFNLKLSEQEKAAKEAVVLPYIHQESGVESVRDDYDDDEDPDDDLDI